MRAGCRAIITGRDQPDAASEFFQQRPQHPRRLFVHRRRWVSRSAVGSSPALSASGNRLRAVRATASWPSTRMRTIASAFGGSRGACERAQLAELGVRARRRMPERADALGHRVDRVPQFGVLGHEHRVQGVEHRPGDVPVEVVGRQVQGVGVGQELRQAGGDRGAVFVADADVGAGGGGALLRHDVASSWFGTTKAHVPGPRRTPLVHASSRAIGAVRNRLAAAKTKIRNTGTIAHRPRRRRLCPAPRRKNNLLPTLSLSSGPATPSLPLPPSPLHPLYARSQGDNRFIPPSGQA